MSGTLLAVLQFPPYSRETAPFIWERDIKRGKRCTVVNYCSSLFFPRVTLLDDVLTCFSFDWLKPRRWTVGVRRSPPTVHAWYVSCSTDGADSDVAGDVRMTQASMVRARLYRRAKVKTRSHQGQIIEGSEVKVGSHKNRVRMTAGKRGSYNLPKLMFRAKVKSKSNKGQTEVQLNFKNTKKSKSRNVYDKPGAISSLPWGQGQVKRIN